MRACVMCKAGLSEQPGQPGRPRCYCSPLCRRCDEYEIRRLDLRLSRYVVELREALARPGGADYVDGLGRTRRQHLHDLRKWSAADEERLRELLGAAGDG